MPQDPWAEFRTAPAQQPQAPRQPAPAQPTVIGGRRVIGDVPPSERRAERADTRAEEAAARAAAAAERTAATSTFRTMTPEEAQAAGLKPGGVYQINGAGNINVVQAPPSTRDGGAISVGAADKAREKISQFTDLRRAINTFQDDYAGNFFGGLENTTEAYIGVGTPGQSEWWADFRATDNLIRNSLFGASLTEGEKAAYNATTVTPGMRPDKVRANLQRRAEIVQRAINREKEFYLANGYKPEAVEALFAVEGLQPQGAQQGQRDDQTPPAFGSSPSAPPPQGPQGGTPDTPPRFVDLRPGAGLSSGDDQYQAGIASGGSQREDNPALAGVRGEYQRRLAEGQTADEILAWAQSAGISQTAFDSIRAQVDFRDKNPNVPIEQYDTTQLDDRFIDLSASEQALNAAGGSAPGAFATGVADIATLGNLDSIIGATGGNAERARLAMGAIQQENPGSYLAGNIVGAVGTALTGEAALGAAGVRAGLGRALAADTALGAGYGAGSTDDGSSRLVGAAQGAALAAGGSYLGQKGGNALAKFARGTTDPNVNALLRSGVNDLTLGQTVGNSGRVGGFVKGVEDRLSGLPVVGDMVNARRAEGMRQFNEAAFNKALEPIGGRVTGKVGQEAIEDAQQQVGEAFRTTLAGKGVVPDNEFATSLTSAVAGVRNIKRLGDEVADQIGDIMRPYADDAMLSGEALDDISRSLRELKGNYMSSADPLKVVIGRRIDAVERSVFDLFDRQASGTIDGYRKARAAYRRVSILEDAVLKAQNQSDQIFSPAQLNRADKVNAVRLTGKRSAARGDTPFNELAVAGQAVLPNKVPDSGTAGRVLIPLAAIGAGGGADAATGGSGTGITIGAIIAGAYSRTGQRVLTKGARGMKPGTARNVLENPRTRRGLGIAGATVPAALINGQQ